ncbi:ShlB/FhaC/HecB family hemolysin secretion/activation protein [Roseateles sp.]|uniref:ShlB/FhaC/HecB family hemolysin secretion/activation protein n=1 Tax=Roseateles sp. TaxID=1971397 RepID=UPI0025E268B2|nr:ShlB/FhaC/HecB family hemolysin secretion/activation protein [Roseateles sp.]MBV8036796.1 ShlB/FhaC/HecB family hemolysin secretion/activation protein [Roseateles sp.]
MNRSKHLITLKSFVPHRPGVIALALVALLGSSGVLAQSLPDAGRTLRELNPPVEPPKPPQTLDILPADAGQAVAPGGPQVELQSVSFRGNTVFSEEQLRAVLGELSGRRFDLAGLRGLAAHITAHYQGAGYPFARALLPAQPLAGGRLQIEVIEGRWGQVRARSDDPAVQAAAQAYLAPLQGGALIAQAPLERALLLLSDLPGVTNHPLVRPGEAGGSGDLQVPVERVRSVGAEAALDNHGSRYNGIYRARLLLQIDSPFDFGDQLQLRAMTSDAALQLGSLDYSLPLGADGWRGRIGYAHTSYELGHQFAALQAGGTAKVASLGLSYPLQRTRLSNVTFSASYQHKDLQDHQDVLQTRSAKRSDSVTVALQFDRRDGLGGGGISYGSLSWVPGRLRLDAAARAADALTANSQGRFDKLSLDLHRIQSLAGDFGFYGHVGAQWSTGNLDSSEDFGLGGPAGVRAYPTSEGFGDRGLLAQLELRYALNPGTSLVGFYDAGRVTINAKPWDQAENHRSLAGAGLGLRWQLRGVSADLSLAWRTQGGPVRSDMRQGQPMAWFNLVSRF